MSEEAMTAEAEIVRLQAQLDEARKATAEFDRMRLLACEEVERIAPVARKVRELEAEHIFLRAECDGAKERLVQAEAEAKALRQLDQLDQALDSMSVNEIDSARARIDTALVPQLAKMLALCLIKADGELYNVVTWALGSTEPFGEMELILQRTEGKTPTQLRIEAEADAQALRHLLRLAQPDVCSLNCPSTWRTADGPPPHSDKCQAISAALDQEHTGTALLDELERARQEIADLRRELDALKYERTHGEPPF